LIVDPYLDTYNPSTTKGARWRCLPRVTAMTVVKESNKSGQEPSYSSSDIPGKHM